MSLWSTRDPVLKPEWGAEPDWSHPLAEGLVGCWLFNEFGDRRAYNPASPRLSASLVNTAGWGGRGIDLPAAGDYLSCGAETLRSSVTGFTIVMRGRVDAMPSGGYGGFLIHRTGTFGTLPCGMHTSDSGTPGRLTGMWRGDATTYLWTGGPVIPTGEEETFLAVSVTGSRTLACVNESTASHTYSLTATQPFNEEWRLFADPFDTTARSVQGEFEYAYLYARALSAGELAELKADPWQILLPTAVARFYSLPTAQVARLPPSLLICPHFPYHAI